MMAAAAKHLALGEELVPAGEEAAIQAVVTASEGTVRTAFEGGDRPARRDAHPKQHGCVRAEFRVEDGLPDDLRHGVFREPRTFPAYIRFSNGSAKLQPDTKGDARGMAIKLMGVEGEKLLADQRHALTQDFVFISHPVFFVRNALDYPQLLKPSGEPRPTFFFPGLNPFSWRLRELFIVLVIQLCKPGSPLGLRYWSMTPYRLGPGAVKHMVVPHAGNQGTAAVPGSPDYLRIVMAEHLKSQPAGFDFCVQRQVDPVRMPIEDAVVRWDEQLSPFQKVATITIPPQTFDTPEQMTFCENLSFTPWHCLPEHRPLGGINRTRKEVYEAVSRLRHQLNGVPREEPSGF
ncbi:MAG TPA: catalase family protein [Isosphaeraceae bacterium]|jgi:hypothetical protein|nr:catalase family protein [Isosphaeraceae bacterium]